MKISECPFSYQKMIERPARQPDVPVQCPFEPAPNSETPAQTASKRSTTIVDTGAKPYS